MNPGLLFLSGILISMPAARAAMVETDPNLKDLPQVAEGFEVSLFARDPLVRNPCSLAFDPQGRMFIGTGPQYRNPKPETPPDSVVMLQDANGDGVADKTHVFATGFNCIQGMAWHGRDLWVGNAPDLTLVRDLDGDDVADEYIRIYTDLGNIEHGLHGLNWAPDGKLYMSKGNSKGLALNARLKDDPERVAPKAFLELWGVKGPPDAPAIPPARTFAKGAYKSTYHDPRDDWGQMGGVLRCDDMGANLEIVSRGMRNPWDIAFDSGFDWLGTDNDQNQGDRLFMPFYGANFGWGHKWSAGWTGENHLPTVPISGPVFTGSGTGIVFADSPAFPKEFRKVWIFNDWLLKKTLVYRPTWDGAVLQPQGGQWQELVNGKDALYRPTDMEFGPDGSLYILGWGRGYGLETDKDGHMTNEGRIFRVSAKGAAPLPSNFKKAADETVPELLADFDSVVIARRIVAQEELIRRGVKDELAAALKSGRLSLAQETWGAWALARQGVSIPHAAGFSNLALQDVRSRPATVADLRHPEPRLRFAAIQSAHQRRQKELSQPLTDLMAAEADRLCFYAAWSALGDLLDTAALKMLLKDDRAPLRRGAFLALMDHDALPPAEVQAMAADADEGMRTLVSLALVRDEKRDSEPQGQPAFSLASQIQVKSTLRYAPATLRAGALTYTDRTFVFKTVPALLDGACMIQTANGDDKSTGEDFLSFEVPMDTIVYVAHDTRIAERPAWLRGFADTDLSIVNKDTTYHLWSRDFPAGKVTLGGNTDSKAGPARSQYFVVLQPKTLTPRATLTTAAEVESLLAQGNVKRGEALFHATGAANCGTCHKAGDRGTVFGPELSSLGARMETKFIIQSILEPNAAITEGFSSHVVEADGKSWFGILLQETGGDLRIGLPGGRSERVMKKSITKHEVLPVSPMPPMAALLAPRDVADLAAYLRTTHPVTAPPAAAPAGLGIATEGDELHIKLGRVTLATYLMKSDIIKRPGFINLRTTKGTVVSRPFPVQEDPKAGGDHADMHPGLWLGFGDVSGTDFWRNKGTIQHVKFTKKPTIENGVARFTALNRLVSPEGAEVAQQTLKVAIRQHPQGWRITLETELGSDANEVSLGAQEEMGLGVRLAGNLIEKAGGLVVNSLGDRGAKTAWGKEAAWWDYSGPGGTVGVLVVPSPGNPAPCWGHTRDYGVMVANITPRLPEKNRTLIPQGRRRALKFDVLIHETDGPFAPQAAAAELIK